MWRTRGGPDKSGFHKSAPISSRTPLHASEALGSLKIYKDSSDVHCGMRFDHTRNEGNVKVPPVVRSAGLIEYSVSNSKQRLAVNPLR